MSSPTTGQLPAEAEAPSTKEAGSLYFAYGSNLHVAQMAQRCPASIFKGKATLPAYRWQVNERGVANVVESKSDSVEGLLYLVNKKDERSLDRSEGVSKRFYQKCILRVTFEPSSRYLDLTSSRTAELLAQRQGAGVQGLGASGAAEAPRRPQQVKALVYISEDYTADGRIREEYISRMQKAVSDAVALGVSRSFVNKYVMPHLSKTAVSPATSPRVTAQERHRPHKRSGRHEAGEIASHESRHHHSRSHRKREVECMLWSFHDIPPQHPSPSPYPSPHALLIYS